MPLRVDQDVAWLEVTMQDVVFVSRVDCVVYAAQIACCFFRRDRTRPVYQLAQVSPLNATHGEKRVALDFADLVNVDDIWVP